MNNKIISKERITEIGKFLEKRLVIHRNVENDTNWSTEEKMIQELYDSYLDLLININNLQQRIDNAIEYCNDDSEYWGNDSYINGKNEGVREVKIDLLSILKGDEVNG